MKRTTSWSPDAYAKNARFVSELGEPLIKLLDPRPGETVMDLGCGDGALTEKIAAAASFIVGVDSSRAFVDAARGRGLQVTLMDAQQLGFKRRFDAVFSNAALHWVKRPERAVEGVADCLKRGGRFVGEFGGKGNVEIIRAALYAALRRRGIDPWRADPWYFPSPQEYSQLLRRFGFTVDYIELIPRPTELPGDINGWLQVFAQHFTNAVAEGEKEKFLEQVRAQLQPALRRSDGSWCADYVRLRFRATLSHERD